MDDWSPTRERLHYDETPDEFAAARPRFADLTDFYPGTTPSSPNGGGKPANPGAPGNGNVNGSAGAPFHHQPALCVLALVAASLLLLHYA